MQDFGAGRLLLSQDARAFDLDGPQEYELALNDAGISGEYTISWETMKNIPSDWIITLVDRKEDIYMDMQSSTSYTFDVAAKQKRPALTTLELPSTKAKAQSMEDSDNRFGITITPSTAVSNEDELMMVEEFRIEQNYPNPFNPSTTIKYAVGQSGPVNISVYNVMGQKVAEILNTTKNAGSYQISWDATAQSSGIYYYRLTAPGQVLTRQMTLIK